MARPTSVTLGVAGDFTAFNQGLSRAVQSAQQTFNQAKFANPFGTISRDTRSFEQSLQAASQRVITFGASLGTLGAAAAILRGIVKETIAIGAAFTDINSVFQLSSTNLQKFSKDVFDVARQTSSSFEDTAEAVKEFSHQGLDATETLKRVRDALILTRISGLGVAESVETITATINTFNSASIDSTTIINKFAAVSQNFAVSSKDLAEGLTRVGAVAQDAGVSFDQLVGLITAAQQATARGGAVIGDAFKTIFTRIERPQSLNQLQDLNIQVKDLQGNALPAIQILKNLATGFDGLSESAKSQATQIVGGTRQINILSSVLKELSKDQGVAAQATRLSTGAFDEAIKRNEALNQSLQSLVAQSKLTAQQIGANIGQVTFADKFKGVVGVLNNNPIVDSLKNIDPSEGLHYGEDLGAGVAKGILTGISDVLSGPAIVYAFKFIGGIVASTFKTFGGDIAQYIGLNKQSDEQKFLTQEINRLYNDGNIQLKEKLSLTSAITQETLSLKNATGGIGAGGTGIKATNPPAFSNVSLSSLLGPNPALTTANLSLIKSSKNGMVSIPNPPPISGNTVADLLYASGGSRGTMSYGAPSSISGSTRASINGVNSRSFDEVFVGGIRREISESGRSLAEAMDIVKANMLKLGVSTEQIDASIQGNIGGLVSYEKNLGMNRYNAEQNRRLSQAGDITSRGLPVPVGSDAYNAVIQQSGMDFSDSYFQRIGKKFGVDTLTDQENKTLNRGVDLARQKAERLLSLARMQGPQNINPLDDLDRKTGFFGSVMGENGSIANQIISDRGLQGNNADLLQRVALQKQLTARQKFGFAASFALPFAAGFIPEGAGGTTPGQVGGASSGALQGAGLGLAIAPEFGLASAGIGGAIGGIVGFVSKINQSFEELAKQIEDSNSKSVELIRGASNFARISDSLKSAASSGASQRDINILLGQQRDAFSSITDPDIKRKLLAAQGNPDALEDVVSSLSQKSAIHSAGNDVVSALGAGNVSRSPFGGIFGGDVSANAFQGIANAIQVSIQRNIDQKGPGFKNQISGQFQSDPLGALKSLGINQSEFPLQDFAKSAKEISQAGAYAIGNLVDFGDEVKNTRVKQADFGRKLKSIIDDLTYNSQAAERQMINSATISKAISDASITMAGGAPDTIAAAQGIAQLQDIQDTGAAQFAGTFGISKSKILGAISAHPGNNDNALSAAVFGAKDEGDLSGLKGLNPDEEVKKAINQAVDELRTIKDNTRLETEKASTLIEISRLQTQLQERSNNLDKGGYSSDTLSRFYDARMGGRSELGSQPDLSRANSLRSQGDILTSLGIAQTNDTQGLRDALGLISSTGMLASIVSQITGDVVGNSLDEVFSSAQRALDKMGEPNNLNSAADADTLQRILGTRSRLLINPDSQSKRVQGLKNNIASSAGIGSNDNTSQTIASLLQDSQNDFSYGKMIERINADKIMQRSRDSLVNQAVADVPFQELLKTRGISQDSGKSDIFSGNVNKSAKNYLQNFFPGTPQITEDGGNIGTTDNPAVSKIIGSFNKALGSGNITDFLNSASSGDIFDLIRTQSNIPAAQLSSAAVEALVNGMVMVIADQNTPALAQKMEEVARNMSFTNSGLTAGGTPSTLPFARVGFGANTGDKAYSIYSALGGKDEKTGYTTDSLAGLSSIQNNFGNSGSMIGSFKDQINASNTNNNPFLGGAKVFGPNGAVFLNPSADQNIPVSAFTQSTIKTALGFGPTGQTPAQKQLSSMLTAGGNTAKSTNSNGLGNLPDLEEALTNAKAIQDTNTILATEQKIYEVKKQIAALGDDTQVETLELGFSSVFDKLQAQIKDFSTVGEQIANSLTNSLGNAFGSFVTGAQRGQDAFRSFITSVLSDSAKAFASKAVQNLLGTFLNTTATGSGSVGTGGGINMSITPDTYTSGITPDGNGYATGGTVNKSAALLTGGEFVVPKERASMVGYDTLAKMNSGAIARYAFGGLVKGGSGIKDDVFAMLRPGDFVMTKSATQKYGSENLLHMIQGGRVQKKDMGGSIASYGASSSSSGIGSLFTSQWGSLAAAGVLGLASALLTKKGPDTGTTLPTLTLGQSETLRQNVEAQQIASFNGGGGALMPVQGPNGYVTLQRGVAPVAHRYASGGEVPTLLMGGETVVPRDVVNTVGAQHFANGGFVGNAGMPSSTNSSDNGGGGGSVMGDVNISVNVAKDGTSTQTTQGSSVNQGTALAKQIKAAVLSVINNEQRQGGSLYTAYGTSRQAQ